MSLDTFNDDLLILTFGELRMKCIKCGVPMLGPEIMVNEGPDSRTCFKCLRNRSTEKLIKHTEPPAVKASICTQYEEFEVSVILGLNNVVYFKKTDLAPILGLSRPGVVTAYKRKMGLNADTKLMVKSSDGLCYPTACIPKSQLVDFLSKRGCTHSLRMLEWLDKTVFFERERTSQGVISIDPASKNDNDGISICEVRDYPITLIGITGPARAGKDTLSKILLDKLGKDWGKASFADPLKQMLGVIGVDCSDEAKDTQDTLYGPKPRQMMQTLGTEWGRELIHPDIWVMAFNYLHGGRKMIVPDVRFENEADLIRERGLLIHLTGRGGIAGNHVSESPIGFKRGDIVIDNSRGLDWLESQVNGNTLFAVLASNGLVNE